MNLAKEIKLELKREADRPKLDLAPITVRLDHELKKEVFAIAERMDKPVNWLLSVVIEKFVKEWNGE